MAELGTILVVDDELESLKFLTNILQADGYQVRQAETGEMALESVRESAPDLILLDIRLSDMDGFEVCRQFKARPQTRDIPLIFISASHEIQGQVEGLRLGAVDFLSKPLQREELLARVRTHLDLGRLRAQLEARVAERTAELMVANRQLHLDLIERRVVEQALRETEERFRNMADTAPVMIWVSGIDKLCTFFNKGWLEFTGRSMEEELGNGWVTAVHPEDLDHCCDTYSAAFEARRSFEMEYRLRRADGKYRWLLDRGVPRLKPNGMFAGYIGSCIDITDLKLNHEQMLARQKLESLGVLAAGIAHDFNNMLASIFAETDIAFAELPVNSPSRDNLNRICAVTTRASEVLKLLMAYAGGKDDETEFEAVDLSSLVQEMLKMLKVSISKKAVFRTSFAKDCPPVRANPTQMRRVVMNLITNASEALGDNEGAIEVRTVCVEIDREHRLEGASGLTERTYVLLEISDTGCGMSTQAQANAFDPFYTTKSAGRGLGLAAVQGIVRANSGAIHLVSAPGKGSTFQIFLPCERRLSDRKEASPAIDEVSAPTGHTILLVEDEEVLRQAISKSLEKLGFSVLTAGDGRAAVKLFCERSREIDLILLDLTLPGISGAEVFREVRRLNPDIKILVTSAYDKHRISDNFLFREEVPYSFIRKPYRIGELVRTLQRTLHQTEVTAHIKRT
jgi:PAS domain S-box-containing protein